jgi:hypothetical protein
MSKESYVPGLPEPIEITIGKRAANGRNSCFADVLRVVHIIKITRILSKIKGRIISCGIEWYYPQILFIIAKASGHICGNIYLQP